MNVCGFKWIIYIVSTCSFGWGTLRRKCWLLERKYLYPDIHLRFHKCRDFELFNFTIAVTCDKVENSNDLLVEVPLKTDLLCLTEYKGERMEAKSFTLFSNLKALYVTGNFELLPGVFDGLFQLSTLWIKLENMSSSITFHNDTFSGLHNLQELKLIGIPFSALDTSMFSHIYQLQNLILEKNNISFLSTVTKSLRRLKTLKSLSIINNDINILRKDDCLHSENSVDFNISFLDLSMNKLVIVENNSLCNFPHLSQFKADDIGLTIDDVFHSGIKTTQALSLSNNRLPAFELCKCVSYLNVQKLLIMHNSIKDIKTSTEECKNLKILNLSHNSLRKIHFNQMRHLKDLKDLDLSHNHISHLNICPNESIHTYVMDLEYLRLSHNFLGIVSKRQFHCLEKLQILALEHNKIYKISDYAFYGLKQLQGLYLQHNHVSRIKKCTFSDLFSLTDLNLHQNKIHILADFPFDDLQKLQKIKITFKHFKNNIWKYIGSSVKHISVKACKKDVSLLAENFNNFSKLISLEVESKNVFVNSCKTFLFSKLNEMYLKNNIYFTCFGSGQQALGNFRNLDKLFYDAHSHESSARVTLNSTLQQLKKLEFLRLENTDKIIGRGAVNVYKLFHGLSNLKILHLKNSGLDHLDSPAIFHDLKSLEFLFIEKQSIQEISKHVFTSMPNLSYVYFQDILFPCNCKFIGFLSWLEYNTQTPMVNFHEQQCFMNSANINLIDFLHMNCQDDLDFKIFISTFISILMFLCISVFHESIWWYTLYFSYRLKCWLNHRLRREVKDQYQYDVFVSYNTSDEQWVIEQLLPNLEQNGPPFFRICIHNRDFEIGRDIVENIVDSIYNSKWTICLITHSYLQSHWCSLEMRMATYRLLAQRTDSLILIFLEQISREELQYYHRLTKLVDTKTYLDWPDNVSGQQLFWTRLRKVIGGVNKSNQ
ncbi:toll-like receptor 13 [Spea bombifrons]|uniref:toll-like receptor 13 n=1 Tax=Spea bombifrons TaxID=233779 RepID=UPI002349FBFD|nr:toll-like receptor 13 [Spea bombifrons]